MTQVPVILDTDIGGDIDDTWALALMLKSPELDVKLVVSDTGDTDYRARIIARMLEKARRVDVPVGVGVPFETRGDGPQAAWVQGYSLSDYPGPVYADGVGAMIGTILNSPDPVTLVCIGPVPNVAEALRREPRIVEHARFVGMHGSVRKGYHGPQISAEYNVASHVRDCQKVFSAAWPITLTPLDTCGLVALQGDKYQNILSCRDPLVRALLENYRIWLDAMQGSPVDYHHRSSVLYDTVAVYLAFAEDLLVMEDLGLRVTDDGYTLIDENAPRMHVATEWRDLGAFEDLVVDRLTGANPPARGTP